MSRRTVIILAGSCITCMVIGLTVMFNISNVDQSKAGTRPTEANVVMLPQQMLILEKSISLQPALLHDPIGPKTLVMRGVKVKRLPNEPLPVQ